MSQFNRRDALRRLALGGVGAAAVPAWVESLVAFAVDHAHGRTVAAQNGVAWTSVALDAHQNETVIALSELIIPETDTPGARTARVNEFVDAVMADAAPAERDLFLGGLAWLDEKSRHLFASDFVGSTPEQQTALLTILASPINDVATDQPGIEFFQAMKSLTITGYYTSEAAMPGELGDDGSLFFTEYAGCTHPEHQ
jgi:hypothetical protein